MVTLLANLVKLPRLHIGASDSFQVNLVQGVEHSWLRASFLSHVHGAPVGLVGRAPGSVFSMRRYRNVRENSQK